jgi:GNAT superfamily N-acetyltransferase
MNFKSNDISLRKVGPEESPLIFRFLTIAARMDESGEPIQKALDGQELSIYWKRWGREGDLPDCCAWARRFSRQEPGHRFVAEDILEIAIGTISTFRGQGIGTAVLTSLLDECRNKCKGISVSVRKHSPAVRLYSRFGFLRVENSEHRNRGGENQPRCCCASSKLIRGRHFESTGVLKIGTLQVCTDNSCRSDFTSTTELDY